VGASAGIACGPAGACGPDAASPGPASGCHTRCHALHPCLYARPCLCCAGALRTSPTGGTASGGTAGGGSASGGSASGGAASGAASGAAGGAAGGAASGPSSACTEWRRGAASGVAVWGSLLVRAADAPRHRLRSLAPPQVDPKSGVTYYCNPTLNVTQWEYPTA